MKLTGFECVELTGTLSLDDRPGLGIVVDESTVEERTVVHSSDE